jgi:hypothetical protein
MTSHRSKSKASTRILAKAARKAAEIVSVRQVPLHHERIPGTGIAAGRDDTKVTARQRERLRIDVGLGGCFLDGAL